MSQSILNNNGVQLAANAVFSSGWLSNDPDCPNIAITVQSDQPGTLILFERTGDASVIQTLKVPISGGSGANVEGGKQLVPATFLMPALRNESFLIQYINGNAATSQFSITYSSNGGGAGHIEDLRLLWMIVKELRAISVLIASLKEPVTAQVNIPYGPDPQIPT
jgi:hypothetical protein